MNKCNVKNRTIFLHDNLEILQGINSGCIDLIYLDPPFNKNKKFTAPIGSSAEGAEFKDIFREEDVKDDWLKTIKEDQPELFQYLNGIKGVGKPYNFAYLAYMAIRLIECQRILKDTGSLYLHCDPTMSHYLKTTLDCVFGEGNFRNEIVWCYRTGGQSKYHFGRKHDVLLFVTKDRPYTFNVIKDKSYLTGQLKHSQSNATYSDEWGTYQEILFSKTLIKLYRDEKGYFTLTGCRDYWNIDAVGRSSSERTDYPTQKPLALLDRVIQASSNKGDIVLDPFCGCATTCVAAERQGREWIGIDVSQKAYDLVKARLDKEVARPQDLPAFRKEIYLKGSPPRRTDVGASVQETKYVYVISHPKSPGEYKVGIAKNVKARLNAYQTSCPDRSFKLEFSHATHLYRQTEAHVHEYFDNRFEWVRGDLEEIKREILAYSESHE